MPTQKTDQETKTYICESRVKLDGDDYEAGEEIELTQKQADQMFGNATPSISELKAEQKTAAKPADNAKPDNTQPELSDEQTQKIIEVINTLDKDDKAHFTASNKPDAKVLSEKCGFNVSAKLRDVIWAELQAANESDES